MSKAKENLMKLVEEARKSNSNVNVGVGEATKEEMEELMALADENGEIEIDGATVKVVKADQIPDDILERMKEELGSVTPGKLAQMMKLSFVSQVLTSDETRENTQKIYDFLNENDIAFDMFLAAATNIALAGFSEKTIGTSGIETDGHYLEYIQNVQTEMKVTQTYLATNPVIHSDDFVPIGLMLALTNVVCDEDVIQEMLLEHRLALFAHHEKVEELAHQKYKLVERVQSLGQSAQKSKEVNNKIEDLVKEKTGKTVDEISSMLGENRSESEVFDFLNRLKEENEQTKDMATDTKIVC